MKTQVLVVDDDVVSRMVLMHLVDTGGSFEIAEAEDGQEAWDQMEAGLRPAIVFCDLRMPRLSGMDLLRRLRASAEFSGVPFVLVSSANDGATVEQATDFGATGYLVKPFLPEQVHAYLAPFQNDDADAEAPLETMQRLGINSERLLVYLGGFQSQLTGAGSEIDMLLARGDEAAARERLSRLQAGGETLGLASAAASIGACAAGPLSVDAVHGALADALRAVVRQSDTVKRLAAS